jgi:hypothetical protein
VSSTGTARRVMGAHLLVLLCLPSHLEQCLTYSVRCEASKSEKKVEERGERERGLSSHSTRQSFAKLAELPERLSQLPYNGGQNQVSSGFVLSFPSFVLLLSPAASTSKARKAQRKRCSSCGKGIVRLLLLLRPFFWKPKCPFSSFQPRVN